MRPAAPHKVDAVSGGVFHVTSAKSGSVYIVRPTSAYEATCTCEAGKHGKACSHVQAARDFARRVLAGTPPEPFSIEAPTVTAEEVFERIDRAEGIAPAPAVSPCTCGADAAGRAHSIDPFCPALNPPEHEFTGMLCVRCRLAIGEDGLCPGCQVDHSGHCHLCGAYGYHRDGCPEIEPEPTVEDVAREFTFIPSQAAAAAKRS